MTVIGDNMTFVVSYIRLYWTVRHPYGGSESEIVDALDTACYDKRMAKRYRLEG